MQEIKLRTMDFSQEIPVADGHINNFIEAFGRFKADPTGEALDAYIQEGIFLCLYCFFPLMEHAIAHGECLKDLEDNLFKNLHDNLLFMEDYFKRKKEDQTWTKKHGN